MDIYLYFYYGKYLEEGRVNSRIRIKGIDHKSQ